MAKKQQHHRQPLSRVSPASRGVAAAVGGAMIVWGLARPRRRDWSTALVGAALLHRGCTGRATFDAWLDLLRTHGRRLGEPQSRSRPAATAPRADAPGDRVEAASQESFPASDPPSYSPGHA